MAKFGETFEQMKQVALSFLGASDPSTDPDATE